jgi:hypothetical protein
VTPNAAPSGRPLRIWIGASGARFGPLVLSTHLQAGGWIAVDDIDGRRGQDLLVVQACDDDVNVPDLLLLDVPWSFRRVRYPGADVLRDETIHFPLVVSLQDCGSVLASLSDELIQLSGRSRPLLGQQG